MPFTDKDASRTQVFNPNSFFNNRGVLIKDFQIADSEQAVVPKGCIWIILNAFINHTTGTASFMRVKRRDSYVGNIYTAEVVSGDATNTINAFGAGTVAKNTFQLIILTEGDQINYNGDVTTGHVDLTVMEVTI